MAASHEVVDTLLITFVTPLSLKFARHVPNLTVSRTESDINLSRLHQHLQQSLNISYEQSLSLCLPVAVCRSTRSQTYIKLPLVTEHIWRNLVDQYPYDTVRVVLETRPSLKLAPPKCSSFFRKELQMLDVSYYLPNVLKRRNLVSLSEDILYKDCYIKPQLRRGLWMHLLGVFHPGLKTKEQRETYINKLRRIYDALKSRLAEEANLSQQIRHLKESVQRDAVRTDPTEPFMALPENIQKLVDIITIYTLEHSEIKYTQGMTDLLSPLLYIMGREDDAYICFAAMFNRIKVNFTEWCEGTLNKLERLKHLCEVLDPELYHHLSSQQIEDPFVLFFGMVLVECRREFNFNEGLHLLEVLWAAALQRDAPSLEQVSQANWASFMTSVSTDVTFQTFGEQGIPYSTQPLEEDSMDMMLSPDIGSDGGRFIPIVNESVGIRGRNGIESDDGARYATPMGPDRFLSCSGETESPLKRSVSLPDDSFVLVDANSFRTQSTETRSEGDIDAAISSTTTTPSGGRVSHPSQVSSANTEMADLSSISSNRNSSGEDNDVSPTDQPPLSEEGEDDQGTLFQCSSEHEEDHETFPRVDVRSKTLPRGHRDSKNVDQSRNTLPRASHVHSRGARSTLPPAAFLHHLSRPSLSSPYVSSIRALDPRVSYPNADLDPFRDEFGTPSPHTSPMRLSPVYTASPHSQINGYSPSPCHTPSPLVHAIQSTSDMSPQQINKAPSSIEASLEVSHVLSGLMSGDHAHPNVNRETSLRIKMADAFSLFVCLAILVRNRHEILTNRMDFVSLSVMLNEQAESQSLPLILKIARQLHSVYFKYQTLCLEESSKKDFKMFETWLDDPSILNWTNTER